MPESRINKAMNAKSPTVLGLDIGGANLKAATAAQRAVSVAFPLWKQPDALPAALASLVSQFPEIDELAVTMTGELCDCYVTKREGVNRILDAVEFAAAGRPVRVWGTGGHWLSVGEARVRTLEVAASNWHALATFAGRFAPSGNGLLVDIGSTTTDIIPMQSGVPTPRGRTDSDRLETKELVYTGVARTPIMALGVPHLCAEYFADIRDANIVLGFLPEEPHKFDTADGRSVTLAHSYARLARMMGRDLDASSPLELESTPALDIKDLAIGCHVYQVMNVSEGISEHEPIDLVTLIVSGIGEWLALFAWNHCLRKSSPRILSLSAELGPEISACAPAYAVAVLASEMPR